MLHRHNVAIDVRAAQGTSEAGIRQLCDQLSKLIPEASAEPAGEQLVDTEVIG
jgi:hypothetical protein